MGGEVVAGLRRRLPETIFDVRLSVAEPEHRVEEFVAAGADVISVHPEATTRLAAVLDYIRRGGCAAGLVLNPETPASAAAPVLHKLDAVVVMLASPGSPPAPPAPAAGAAADVIEQTLRPAMDKLRELAAMCREEEEERSGGGSTSNNRLWIAVEGGVSRRTAADFIANGMGIYTAVH